MALQNNDENLYKIFNNVNDWLKFAEAKNAMIIAFNAASVYGIVQIFNFSNFDSNGLFQIYLIAAIIQLVISLICSLLSFVPKLEIVTEGYFIDNIVSNIFFFEYLKTKSKKDLVKEVNGQDDNYTRIELDIAEQIIQNSKIVSRKYSWFTISLWLTISAYISPPGAVILILYTYITKK